MGYTIKQYRPFFTFLIKFVVFYAVLSVAYIFYLKQFDTENNETDTLTKAVAHQVYHSLLFFGQEVESELGNTAPAVIISLNNKKVARIVEGCNAVSVMILFASFIVAFSNGFKRTLFYIMGGIFIIHVFNIARIDLLTYALYHYYDYRAVLHDIVFPLLIYGVVFLLWILWISKFSDYAKKTVGS